VPSLGRPRRECTAKGSDVVMSSPRLPWWSAPPVDGLDCLSGERRGFAPVLVYQYVDVGAIGPMSPGSAHRGASGAAGPRADAARDEAVLKAPRN
jgi:hypothetical protein